MPNGVTTTLPTRSKTETRRRPGSAKNNGSSTQPAGDTAGALDLNVLLKTLIAFKKGNFSVRMPVDLAGVNGKIADTLNEILELNQRMVSEFDRTSRAVGKEGRISHRASM